MPVEFTKTADQEVNFGDAASLINIDAKTISFWFSLDAWAAGTIYALTVKGGWNISLVKSGALDERIRYVHSFSGDDGLWYSDDNAVSAATTYHCAVTYDRTATTNNPIIYLNGSSININETGTPTGTVDSDSGNDFLLGNSADGTQPHDGKMWDVRAYGEILSAGEIASIYAKKSYRLSAPFPVFRVKAIGATGLQVYDGVSLAAGNKLIDDIAGVAGTPAQSPVGHSDALLAYQG